jgi:aspartate/glutamate racemase
MPRIALIHATKLSIPPICHSFDRLWPEAELVQILDDSLSRDRAAGWETTERIHMLADYALSIRADAILFCCSAFGKAIGEVQDRLTLPVLKPNEAMFEDAFTLGRRFGMLATFIPSIASMEEEFHGAAPGGATLDTAYVEGAREASDSGDGLRHDRLIAEAAGPMEGYDAIMLAHFSMSSATGLCGRNSSIPILTAPDSAVKKLKEHNL